MNKRGQFYIIIAIIISLALLTVSVKINRIKEPILFEDFSDVSTNYITESRSIVNHALYTKQTGPDLRYKVDNFTSDFLNIMKQNVNPSLQILYVYSDGENLTVGNHFNSSVTVENSTVLGSNEDLVEELTLNVGGIDFVSQVPVKVKDFGAEWYSISPSGEIIQLSIGGIAHNFQVSSNNPELKAIVRTTTGTNELILGGNNSLDPEFRFSPEQQRIIQQNVYQ